MIFLGNLEVRDMENVIKTITEYCTTGVIRILLAIAAWFIGKMIINALLKGVKKIPAFAKLDQTVALFAVNIVKAVLYAVLAVSIIGILGVPMASVVAVLASAGLAVGMSLQGALSNVAGGIMLMVLRPFNVGDYVEAAGVEGTVSAINLFYTSITTPQNSQITVPNGALMGANVVNMTANDTRRLDMTFSIGKDSDLDTALRILNEAAIADEKVLKDPAPSPIVAGGSDTSVDVALRVWVAKDDYLSEKAVLTKTIVQAFGKAGITAPAVRIISDK